MCAGFRRRERDRLDGRVNALIGKVTIETCALIAPVDSLIRSRLGVALTPGRICEGFVKGDATRGAALDAHDADLSTHTTYSGDQSV